jgi:heme A synthase
MRALILLAVITFLVVTVVMAVVFRDRRSKERLRFMARVGWIYVAVVIALAAWRLYSD